MNAKAMLALGLWGAALQLGTVAAGAQDIVPGACSYSNGSAPLDADYIRQMAQHANRTTKYKLGCFARPLGGIPMAYPDPANPKSDPTLLQTVTYDPFQLMPAELPDRPRGSFSAARIERARARLAAKAPVDLACYAILLANCRLAEPLPTSIPNPDPEGVFAQVANLAFKNALVFLLNGQEPHRARALAALRLAAGAAPRQTWSGIEYGIFCKLASAYDCLAATELTDEDEAKFRDMLLAIVPVLDKFPHRGCNNHNPAVQVSRLAVGAALGRRELMHDALYGLERDGKWRYGLIHLLRHDLLADGMQWEGSISYHMFVLYALAEAATILENCGVDLWHKELPALLQNDAYDEHRDYGPKGRKCLKAAFDIFFYQMFPNGDYSILHDQILGNIRGVGGGWPLIPKAHEVYGDPKYAWLMNRINLAYPAANSSLPYWLRAADTEFVRLEARQYPAGEFALSRDARISQTGRQEGGCTLLPAYGAAILRPEPDKPDSLAASLYFGPHSAGHRSPAALHLEIHAGGQRITQAPHIYDAGYNDPRHLLWNRTTIAHNTVTMDERAMFPFDFETDSPWEWDIWRDNISDGELLSFQPRETWKAVRARNDNVYEGVLLDRTVVVTPDYLVDVYRVLGAAPHLYDWAMHCHGEFSKPAKTEAVSLGDKRGYRFFSEAWADSAQRGWVEVPFQMRKISARCRILLPEGQDSRLLIAKDPVPDKRTPIGDIIPPLPRTTIMVRTRATKALFLSVWSFDGRALTPELESGAAEGDLRLTVRRADSTDHWEFPVDAGARVSFSPGEPGQHQATARK